MATVYMYMYIASLHFSQDVDRLHREINGLNSTVAAQGKEVERLQRENLTLKAEIDTHKITVSSVYMHVTYPGII